MNKKKIVGIQYVTPKNKNPFYFIYVEYPMDSNSNGTGLCTDKYFVTADKMITDLKVNDYIVVGYNSNGFLDFIIKV